MHHLGFDPDRINRIERFLTDKYITPGLLPCAQVAVLRGGEVAYECLSGLADRERGRPLEADAIFRIYSMTKPITSIAFMMLVEEGKVALDDPVHRFIHAFRNLGVYRAGFLEGWQTVPTAGPMRIVDLLRHTSGLTYGFQSRTNVDRAYVKLGVLGDPSSQRSLDEFIDELSRLPLEFSPGEAWNYSVSTDVLGYLVGVISGVPFEDFLRTRIFEPLGMTDTGFSVPAEKAHRLTSCYTGVVGGPPKLIDDCKDSGFLKPPAFPSGGGGLCSTMADYLQFVRMLLNRGELDGQRLIGRKTLDLMTANHLPGGTDMASYSVGLFSEATNAGSGFGLGFAVNIDPVRNMLPGSVGEYYWGGMASTAFWVDPAEELAVVFMTQLTPSRFYPVRRELRTLVYSALT